MTQAHTGTARTAGIPLGGVDTGYITVYPDGTLSDLCLPGEPARKAAPVMPGAFAALRVQSGARLWTRILADAASVPPSASGVRPHGLVASSMGDVFRYPKVAFRISNPELPIEFRWAWHGSVIPFDHDASCMPAVFLRAELTNTSAERAKCSLLVNMAPPPLVSGEPAHAIMPLLVEHDEHMRLKPEGHDDAEEQDQGPVRNAVFFGGPSGGPKPAVEACLAARAWNARFSTAAWNPRNAIEEARLWEDFGETGRMPRVSASRAPSHGAVCCDLWLNPGEKRHVVFVHAWHRRAPAAEAPAYAALWGNAREVARHGLRHADYLFAAVGNWHARLLDAAAVPPWLGARLVQSTALFTRNAALAADGTFRWRPDAEGDASRDRFDLHLPLMLFFPRYEAAALATHAAAERTAPSPENAAAFVLSVYRDYLHTGSLAHLQEFWPAVLRDANASLLNAGAASSAGIAGRRVAALRACVHLAEAMHDPAGTSLFEACRRAWVDYETRFWDKDSGLYGAPGDDPAEAMSGLCLVAALRMDDVAQPQRIAACLRALARQSRPKTLSTASLARLALLERHYVTEPDARRTWTARLAARLEKDTTFDLRLLWQYFQAVGGMLYAVPEQRIYLDPRPGVHGAETVVNLMTPLCFGRMHHRETAGTAGPEIQTDLELDSPVIIREVVLRLPEGLNNPLARCTISDDPIPCDIAPRTESGRSEALIRFRYPVRLAAALSIFVRETVVEKKRWGWLR